MQQGEGTIHLFQHLPQAVLVLDTEGTIRQHNPRAEALTGYSASEMLGAPIVQIITSDERERAASKINRIVQLAEDECTCDTQIIARGDQPIPVTMSMWLIDASPPMVGVIIHERMEASLAEALQDSAAALNSTLELDDVLERILDNVGRVVAYEAADIMMLEGEEFVVAAHRGYDAYGVAEWVGEFRIHLDANPVWRAKVDRPHATVTPDTHTSDSWHEIDKSAWIRSNMHIPIADDDDLIGYLNLNSSQPNFFVENDVPRVIPFANQAATAIKNARLFAAERAQRRTAEVLTKLTASLIGTLDLDELFMQILVGVEQVVPHDAANIMLIDDGIGHIVSARGYEKYGVQGDITQIAYHVTEISDMKDAYERAIPVVVGDTSDWEVINPEMDTWQRSNVKAPIRIDNTVAGFIILDSAAVNHFTYADAQRLQSFADLAAIAIKNARLFRAEHVQRAFAEAQTHIATSLNSMLDLGQLLSRLLESLQQVVPHKAANVVLIQDGAARVVSSRGYEQFGAADYIKNWQFRLDEVPHMARGIYDNTLVLIPDVHADAEWQAHARIGAWLRSHVRVPIRLDDRVVGAIMLDSDEPNAFNLTDAEKLQSFSDHAAIAIRNARLFAAEHEQRAFAEAQARATTSLNSTLDLRELLERLLESLEPVVPHTASNVMLIEEGVARVVSWRGYEKYDAVEYIDGVTFDVEAVGLMQQSIGQGLPILVSDTHAEESWIARDGIIEWLRTHLKAPIRLDDAVVGFINVDSDQPHAFSMTDAHKVQAFADHAAIAIKNARLFAAEHEQRAFAEAQARATTSLNSTLDLSELLSRLLESLEQVVPHEAANVMLVEDGIASVVSWRGYDKFGVAAQMSNLSFEISSTAHTQSSYESGLPDLIPDVKADDTWVGHEGVDDWIRAHLKAPIRMDERVVGFICLDSDQPNAFTLQDAHKVQAFADHAAIAIRNARLFAAEHEQRAFAEAQARVTTSLNSTLDLSELLSRLLESLNQVVPYDAANVMLITDGFASVVSRRGYEQFGADDYVAGVTYEVESIPHMRRAVKTAELVLVRDTILDDDWEVLDDQIRWLRTHLKVPIRAGEDVVGFISLDSDKPNAFTMQDAHKVQAFADHAAIAIKNARLFKAEREQRAFVEAQVEMTTSLNSTLDLRELLSRLLKSLEPVMSHVAANVMLIEDGVARTASWRGYDRYDAEAHIENLTLAVASTPDMRRSIESGSTMIVGDTRSDPDWVPVEGIHEWMRSHIKAPIRLGDRVVGFINLDSDVPHHFTEQDAQKLKSFTEHAAIAIRNTRLFQAERDQRQLAEALQDTSLALSQTLDLDEVLERILDNLGRVIPHDTANIMLLKNGNLRVAGSPRLR